MTREQAMLAILESDTEEVALPTAGADAERARVVVWLRHKQRGFKYWLIKLILGRLINAIERGDHWQEMGQ
jgi:hypothetical protein